MARNKIYPALLTADLAAAESWYTKLLGRGPDHRAMDTLAQWELSDRGGLMLSSSDEIAGNGVIFLHDACIATYQCLEADQLNSALKASASATCASAVRPSSTPVSRTHAADGQRWAPSRTNLQVYEVRGRN